jgi:hypothetical protein
MEKHLTPALEGAEVRLSSSWLEQVYKARHLMIVVSFR